MDFEFTLPYGYSNGDGQTHRVGRMRMATALDEIESVAHPRVQANEAYLPIILLSRVITQLGTLPHMTPAIVEQLYAADLAYLEDVYLRLNSYEGLVVRTVCPHCSSELQFKVAPARVDEGDGTQGEQEMRR